jgi:Dyp-type peroxidase family
MNSAFNTQLDLTSNGQTVVARGPCDWDDDDESAEIRNVTIQQGRVVASNSGPSTVRKDTDQDWWLELGSSGQLTGGRALASAVAVVRRTDGSTYEFSWPDEVQLVQPGMALNLREIQGNIVAGFNKDSTSYLFLALPDDPARARAWLAELVGQVATAEEVKQFNDLFRAIRLRRGDREGAVEAAWMNLAFTHEGLGKLGVAETELDQFPEEFREGMRRRKATIGDVGDNDPERWPNDLGTRTIHALMIVAADSVEDLHREVLYFIGHAASHGVSLVFQQDGTTRSDAPGHEHFGFRDGISQPAIRGLTESSYPGSSQEDGKHQDLVAGGEFVVGYPRERSSTWDLDDDPLSPRPEWAENGSYLVFRRLRQDVKGFQDFLAAEAARRETTVDLLGAKLVGRYRSGAPLVGAGDAAQDPGTTDPEVLGKARINAFGYAGDPKGTQVPRAAHIRKTYPRDQQASGGELGERPRILRRGIPFGQSFRHGTPADSPFGADPQFPDDRGLCFVCYQRSIRDQFERIQCTWVNQEAVPEAGDGVDAVASQASAERRLRIPGTAADPVHLPKQWVATTGGEYFFSPSIGALKRLSRRPSGAEQS